MTELIWDGKYENGKKVAPVKVCLPFQTVETVNESSQERQKALDMFGDDSAKEWRNRLIWGDKKYVLPSLLPEFAGKVNLIYIDPPFDTGADFSFSTTIPETDESFAKEPSMIEQKAYRDTWGKGLDSYLKWFYETVTRLREFLAADGSIYLHLDWHVGHYAKIIMDEVFGPSAFHNEIIWKRQSAHNDSSRCGSIHDTILLYANGDKSTWNEVLSEPSPDYIESFFDQIETGTGRRYARGDLSAGGLSGGGYDYEYKGVRRVWRCPRSTMEELDRDGRLHWPKKGVPRLKRYLDEFRGVPLQDVWTDVRVIHNQSLERAGYPTQKPESLLERIITASSNSGDLVLDCFCGSGTTAAVAEKLGRRWITCDLGRFAIHTTRKRLLGIEGVQPFVVQNLGKYERQHWQKDEFGDKAEARDIAYRKFILELYRATPITGYIWLHGVRNGRMVHVGGVDAPVTVGDVTAIATEFRRAMGSGENAPTGNGIDVLGWDFAFEINEVAKQQAAGANIAIRFLRIPREVLEKKAVEQGDIRFFELAALGVESAVSGRSVTLRLTDFIIPPDEVPSDVQAAITHWEQWIDYWAVDWDNRGDTFHNEWQTYRTRKNPSLQRQAARQYEQPGTFRIVVKVIDILGNDTTKTLTVQIA